MGEPLEPINVSALNQYSYCPRRCALIYLESEFSDNVHTSRGNAEHERVDRVSHSTSKDGARVEYALPIWSERLGLIGKCDVVEFWPDGTVYPVEYKHGSKKQRDNDDLQLVAQALCLSEMLGKQVIRGAIFHAASKRRREIEITQQLTDRVATTIAEIRLMLSQENLPPPVNDKRCPQCSLQDICQPRSVARLSDVSALKRQLFDPEV
ncbi:MAG: CRISPR-associated protein Cas4 [Steroidobacter sp.]